MSFSRQHRRQGCPRRLAHGDGLEEDEDLKVLGLAENPVTDAAIDDLSQLEGLRALDLQGTLVTRQGVKRLRAALPGCAIINRSG